LLPHGLGHRLLLLRLWLWLRRGELLLGARFGGLHARDLRGIELSLRAQMRHHILGAIRRAGGLIVRALARDELLECSWMRV